MPRIGTQEKVTEAQALEIAGPEELIQRINALQELVAQKDQEIESLKNQAKPTTKGRGGWLVETPSRLYNGLTAGIQFRAGRAFIPDGKGAETAAKMLRDDFRYQVQYVEDWQELPVAEEVSRSFVDVLTGAPR